jgi:hypothetical protein
VKRWKRDEERKKRWERRKKDEKVMKKTFGGKEDV